MDTGQLIAEHYRLAEHVGSGAMGVVWKAVDVRLERPVAVKQIITQQGLSPQERDNVRQRAMREAKNAARLQHPNAIVVFDIVDHAGDPCLVMEYMPAKSLSGLLAERGPLPIPEVARIGEQVAGALVAAHRAGIVHRDVKPGNILIDDTGTTKITDFGISRAAGDMTLTQTGLIGGTPAYLAPELARGADPTPASDVFALGATLYHVIEGQPVYGESENQLALLYAAASGKIIPPSQAGPATALLMNLLRADPEERPSMSETRQQLAALAGGNGKPTAAPPPGVSGGMPPQAQSPSAPPKNAAPPWQRTNRADSGPPARNHTAAFTSVGENSAPHSPAQRPAASPASNPPTRKPPERNTGRADGGSGKRKPFVLASAAAAVLIVIAIVTIVLTSGGGGEQTAQSGDSVTHASPDSPSNEPSSAAPTTAKVVHYSQAATFLGDEFYMSAQPPWKMLTPAVQQKFGSRADFADYWNDLNVQYWKDALIPNGNNPDGSVNIHITVVTEDGDTRTVVKVVKVGGQYRVASDPRLHATQQN